MYDGSGETIYGYGLMSFQKDLKGKITTGTGYFVDSRTSKTKRVQCDYTLHRLTKKDLYVLTNKKSPSISGIDEIRNLIIQYHHKFGKNRSILTR
mgnify:CR=1 FL=1